ncbi:hypothetical protein [Rufibacter tibetensis]|uniref:Uncharacterized protein n=1 Tax=Rufibacter tibetensis TaxID=512763 RepID=A0A0P0CT98_9BACT|nr:hypothetical protein [Rufibacter tibetensis]ALI99802.1 hypothetical protein DC20_13495 [Rufibacter tibetensis]
MEDQNKNQGTPQQEGSGSNNSQDGNNGEGVFADHNYGTKAEGGNTANYDADGNFVDFNGKEDYGTPHVDINGGGDIQGRRGGGYGEKDLELGKHPTGDNKQAKHDAESDKDTGYGTHAGGLSDSHSGFKGNHNGNDGTGGGRSSGHAGHGGDPDDEKYSPNKGGKDQNNDPDVAGRGARTN